MNKKPKYVKALISFRRLERGKVYEVVEEECDEYYLREAGWQAISGFEVMPPTYDHLEEQVRAFLTTPVHPCSCKKCGAPKPCAYHG